MFRILTLVTVFLVGSTGMTQTVDLQLANDDYAYKWIYSQIDRIAKSKSLKERLAIAENMWKTCEAVLSTDVEVPGWALFECHNFLSFEVNGLAFFNPKNCKSYGQQVDILANIHNEGGNSGKDRNTGPHMKKALYQALCANAHTLK